MKFFYETICVQCIFSLQLTGSYSELSEQYLPQYCISTFSIKGNVHSKVDIVASYLFVTFDIYLDYHFEMLHLNLYSFYLKLLSSSHELILSRLKVHFFRLRTSDAPMLSSKYKILLFCRLYCRKSYLSQFNRAYNIQFIQLSLSSLHIEFIFTFNKITFLFVSLHRI